MGPGHYLFFFLVSITPRWPAPWVSIAESEWPAEGEAGPSQAGREGQVLEAGRSRSARSHAAPGKRFPFADTQREAVPWLICYQKNCFSL